jgi:parvulin-like peptidyl-prolyl isomerase
LTPVIALAMAGAACGVSRGGDGPLASITFADGSTVEIQQSEVDVISAGITSSDRFVQLAYGGAIPESLDNTILGQVIGSRMINQALANAGSSVSTSDLADGRAQLVAELTTVLQEQGEAEPAAAAEEVAIEIRGYVDLLSLNIKGSEVLSDALAEQGAEGDEIPCVRHILVDTEEVSDDIFAQLEDGGDFAALAAEFTTDPSGVSSGGDLGCSPADRYVPEFMDAVNGAEIGVPVQVQTDFGYHILEVTAIEVDNSAAVGDAISAVFDSAMVEVDPLVGTWDAASGTIIPAN